MGEARRNRNRRFSVSDLQVYLYPLLGWFFLGWFHLLHRFTTADRRGPFWDYLREGRPCIVTIWHQDSLTGGFEIGAHARSGYRIVSHAGSNRIGAISGYLLGIVGIEMVYGSHRRRGVQAINRIIEMVKDDPRCVYLTADGSRGPDREARWGAIHLAKETGMPIIGLRARSRRCIFLKSTWMKLALPAPWGRRLILTSEPLFVPPDADKETLESCRARLERRMNAMAAASDEFFLRGTLPTGPWDETVQLAARN